MIDHLIRCSTQAEADALQERFGASRAHQFRVVLKDAVWDMTDPENPALTIPEITAPGYHVWVSLDAVDEGLRDLPNNACRWIGDRSRGGPGATWSDVLLYHAADLSPEMLSSTHVEPVPAGSDYPFGNMSPADHAERLRREMLARLDHLEALVQSRARKRGGIGDNNPPEAIDDLPTEVNLDELLEAVTEARHEGHAPVPDLKKGERIAGRFRQLGNIIGRWLAERTIKQIDGAISDVRKVAFWGVLFYAEELYKALIHTAAAISDWVSALPLPF